MGTDRSKFTCGGKFTGWLEHLRANVTEQRSCEVTAFERTQGKMIPLGCNMYVVLKVQNENGSRLVIVFLLPFLYFYPIFFLYILLKYFLNQFIKWYECQKVFCHSFDTSDCDPATLLPQSSKYSKSADLLRKSLLSHIWHVPSSNTLSCKHERLFDLLTLVSQNNR